MRRPPPSTPFPYTTLFRSFANAEAKTLPGHGPTGASPPRLRFIDAMEYAARFVITQLIAARMSESYAEPSVDRKSTRLNSSHVSISYAVFCLKKKKETIPV